jgi:hypothetical protein
MKQYLIQLFQHNKKLLIEAKENDIIEFEMPSFCSGDYHAIIYKDDNGLYIEQTNNHLSACRDYRLIKK